MKHAGNVHLIEILRFRYLFDVSPKAKIFNFFALYLIVVGFFFRCVAETNGAVESCETGNKQRALA